MKIPQKAIFNQLKQVSEAIVGQENEFSSLRIKDAWDLVRLLTACQKQDWAKVIEYTLITDQHIFEEYLEPSIKKMLNFVMRVAMEDQQKENKDGI